MADFINNIAAEVPKNSSNPPSEDSPKNIVNILNDDCIQKILLNLDDIVDFLRAAEVCSKFQDNAKMCFPFKTLEFIRNSKKRYKPNELTLKYAKRFLSIFGPLVKSIKCDFDAKFTKLTWNCLKYYRLKSFCDKQFGFISKYCGKTLIELMICNCHGFKMRSPFQKLKKLEILNVNEPRIFNNKISTNCRKKCINATTTLPQLTHLKLENVRNVTLIANHFPKIQHVEFNKVKNLKNSLFIDFQRQNPHLQSLYLSCCSGLASSVWRDVGKRMPNIKTLYLSDSVNRLYIGDEFMYFVQIYYGFDLGAEKYLISSVVENERPTENVDIYWRDIELAQILANMQTIRKLKIGIIPPHRAFLYY